MVLALAAAAALAYGNSFAGVFVFDDVRRITENPGIRHFGSALLPLGARTVGNLSFAFNNALARRQNNLPAAAAEGKRSVGAGPIIAAYVNCSVEWSAVLRRELARRAELRRCAS
jgi:hypothetical protein